MWQLMIANHRTPNESTMFPIHRDRQSFERARTQREYDIGNSANPIFEALNPYRGGNQTLIRLHDLDIVDKHRLPIATVAGNFRIETGPSRLPLSAFLPDDRALIKQLPAGASLKDGMVLFKLPAAEKPEDYQDPQFSFYVGLGEICDGEPIPGVLYHLCEQIKSIATIFFQFLE
jgi:hypothetical protein